MTRFTPEQLRDQRNFQNLVEREQHEYFDDPRFWITSDKRRIPFSELNDFHIKNILARFDRGGYPASFQTKINQVAAEAIHRGLIDEGDYIIE